MQIHLNILDYESDLHQAVRVLEDSSIKICVVLDDSGRVKRTITDGDVRRALLAGSELTTPVAGLPGKPPVVLPDNTDPAVLASELKTRDLDVIVLVDADGRPTGLADRNEFFDTLLLSPPHMGLTEAGYVQQAFDDNWLAPAGPNLCAFEAGLRAVSGRAHALAVSSGTAGLHLALRVLDIGVGDRVYVADLTFVATVQPVLYERATPVLIDAEPESWNISPSALARALARDAALGQLPKAIIVVHLYGQSADMAAIMALSELYCVPVIEDAAESLGATYGNRPSGAHGLLSVYSFNGNKIITTSGGGALLSDRDDLIARAQNLSMQGRDKAEHYQHSEVAYNYRMSNVLAGIGRGQLEVLAERIAARRAIFDRYIEGLGDVPGISFQSELPGSVGNRWLTVISLDPNFVPIHSYQLMRGLRVRGIETRPAWKPMQMQPLLLGAEFEPHAEDAAVGPGLFLTSLCLPSGSAMTVGEQDHVIGTIRSILLRELAS